MKNAGKNEIRPNNLVRHKFTKIVKTTYVNYDTRQSYTIIILERTTVRKISKMAKINKYVSNVLSLLTNLLQLYCLFN